MPALHSARYLEKKMKFNMLKRKTHHRTTGFLGKPAGVVMETGTGRG